MLRSLKRESVYILLSILASAVIGVVAIFDLSNTVRYGGLLALESLLRKGEPVSARAVANYAQHLSDIPETCRTDILDAAVAVAMQNIEQEAGSPDRSAWIASLRSMEPLLRGSLACMPTNGLLWGRLAVVRWLLGGTAEEQASLLTMSQAYAPAELPALRGRMIQWRRVSPPVLELAEHALRADIRVILNYAPVSAVKSLLADVPPLIRPFLADEALALPRDRRDVLDRAGIKLD